VEDAQLLGSLNLSGFEFPWEEVKASRRGEPAHPAISGLRRAVKAVDARAPFSLAALLAWHEAVVGATPGYRQTDRLRADAPAPAPPGRIGGRLAILDQWLNAASGHELKPVQQGALVLARLVEILPFEDGNGRVSRLAASHLMVRAGMRPPILVGGDGPRLIHCLGAAFQLHLEPLAALLEEASERCLDVMIRTLESIA
jgi:Fic/DOC family